MEADRWLEALALSGSKRAAWVRAWREGRSFDEELRRSLAATGSSAARRRRVERLKAQCARSGVEIVLPGEELYVEALLELHDPPLALFLRGDRELLRLRRRVGVIGARRGTARGRRCAESLGASLARAGVVVVSGLALGVDGAAHRGCLAAGGRPIGVLGTGLDRCHPSSHRRLHEEVLSNGLLVSEYAPGVLAQPYHFLARNRVLAALCEAVVVVEAGARSGALSTVDFAQQLGLEVMAVPGPVDCPHAVGCLALLREGAVLVRHGEDVIDSLGWPKPPPGAASPFGLGGSPEGPEEIARRLGWPLTKTLAALSEAEMHGEIQRVGGGRYRAVIASRPQGAPGEVPTQDDVR